MSSSGMKQDWHCLATGRIALAGPTGLVNLIPRACGNGRASAAIKMQTNWIGPQTSRFTSLTLRGRILFASCLTTLWSSNTCLKGSDGRNKQSALEHLQALSQKMHTKVDTHMHRNAQIHTHTHTLWAVFLFRQSMLSQGSCLHVRGHQPSCVYGLESGQKVLRSGVLKHQCVMDPAPLPVLLHCTNCTRWESPAPNGQCAAVSHTQWEGRGCWGTVYICSSQQSWFEMKALECSVPIQGWF